MCKFVLRTEATAAACRRLSKAAIYLVTDSFSNKELLYKFDLALTEALANVARHAYRQSSSQEGCCVVLGDSPAAPQTGLGDVELTLRLNPGKHIELEVADWGVGFGSIPKDFRNAKPDAENGRGVFIMAELTQALEFRRHEDKNIVYLKMEIEEKLWKDCE